MRDPKALIRREVAARFAALSAEELAERSAAIRNRLMFLKEFGSAGSFLLYASMADEVDTAPLIDGLLAAGRPVFLPVCRPGRAEFDAVSIRSRSADLVPGRFGILEPRLGLVPADTGDVEFALVPGLAFDRQGARIGRGGGYYDRFLARLHLSALRVALALEFQVYPAVPTADHDQRVDLIVTEREIIRVAERSKS
jgi:5-formyltetrahydrofolate cyclo-ligase